MGLASRCLEGTGNPIKDNGKTVFYKDGGVKKDLSSGWNPDLYSLATDGLDILTGLAPQRGEIPVIIDGTNILDDANDFTASDTVAAMEGIVDEWTGLQCVRNKIASPVYGPDDFREPQNIGYLDWLLGFNAAPMPSFVHQAIHFSGFQDP